MNAREFINNKYPHLKNEDDNCVIDITLSNMQIWLNEYADQFRKPTVIKSVCEIEGCELPATCNGKCGGHCDCLA